MNVRIGLEWIEAINATTSDESMPPDRNAPSGTSEIILDRTLFVSASSVALTASSYEPRNGVDRARIAVSAASKYTWTTGDSTVWRRVSTLKPSAVPGISFRAPTYIVPGAGQTPCLANFASVDRSMVRSKPGRSESARSSDAKDSDPSWNDQ